MLGDGGQNQKQKQSVVLAFSWTLASDSDCISYSLCMNKFFYFLIFNINIQDEIQI